MGHLASHNPRPRVRAARRHRMTQRTKINTQHLRAHLIALLALALLVVAPNLHAQSGRIKQPTTKTTTPSSGGSTRPKRASTNSDSQNQSSQQTSTPPARLDR